MFNTLRGFALLWVLVYSYMGFMVRKINPIKMKISGKIAFFLMINALTGFILLVAFYLSRKSILDQLGRLFTASWGF